MDLVQKGDGGEWQIFVRRQEGDAGWRMVADLGDECIRAVFGGRSLFLLSLRGAPRGQVLRLELGDDGDRRRCDGGRAAGRSRDRGDRGDRRPAVGGGHRRRPVGHPGLRPRRERPAGGAAAGDQLDRSPAGRSAAGAVAWAVETFVSPRSWWVHADDDAEPRRTALDTVTPIDFAGIEVERVFATSKDGTRVPINLMYRAGTPKDGSAPAVLYGYGGFAISLKPSFQPSRLLWLEQGGVYAVANIRGGGEYGREWHHAGRLATKQNCFDDFAACADHLVQTGVTSRERLGIMGGSNGGLLMGAVAHAAPRHRRRRRLRRAGARHAAQRAHAERRLQRDRVRHRPRPRACSGRSTPTRPTTTSTTARRYPPVLFTAGEFDPRVEAHHAKKMVARLQAATSSDQPILLRMESGGHGIGQSLDQLVGLVTDYYTFFFDRMRLPYRAP